jgi:hypothetical protein
LANNKNTWWRALEWTGRAETIHSIMQAEFFRTLLLPMVTTVATGAAGVLGHIPLMWVIMATSLAFAGTAVGLLSASTYLERRNPAHKLQVMRTLFNFELVPISGPNRKQRRYASKEGGAPAVPAFRHFVKGQLGFEVWNRSSLPISLQVLAAETDLEGLKPPRGKFPKKAVIIQPGTTMWVHDDPIILDMDCDDLDGMTDITVKYGLQGKERFEIHHKGTVEIFMEPYGLLKNVYFHPDPLESDQAAGKGVKESCRLADAIRHVAEITALPNRCGGASARTDYTARSVVFGSSFFSR